MFFYEFEADIMSSWSWDIFRVISKFSRS